MPDIKSSKKYQNKGEIFFNDGREIELLQFIYAKSDVETMRGNPKEVLAAIDEYARGEKYLMNVGEDKGKIVTDMIKDIRPRTMVELGGYVGYSCILFADAMRANGGLRYLSLERNPVFAAVIMALVDLAGLSDIVKVIVGPSDESIRRLRATHDLGHIDLLFLDHYKPAYTTDLKLCEELGLIKSGSVLMADNVIYPGNPPYLEYVRSDVRKKRAAFVAARDDKGLGQFENDAVNQYRGGESYGPLNKTAKGNPNLKYESVLVDGFEPSGEPDGIEITRCIGVQQDGL